MPVELKCTCGTAVQVPNKYAEKKVNCPICKKKMAIGETKPKPWWEDPQKSIERIILGSQPEPKPGERLEDRTERSEQGPDELEEYTSDEPLEGLEGVHGWSGEELHSLKRKGLWASRAKLTLVSLVILVLALLLVFLIMRPKVHRVERTGGLGEIREMISAPEELSEPEDPAKSAKENLQLQEDLTIPSPTVEFDSQGGMIESSSSEPLGLQKDLRVFAPDLNASESQAIEERDEEVVSLESDTGLIRQSPLAGGAYTVNVGSFREKARADRYVEELRQRGFEAFDWEVDLPQKGRWHRVSIGEFSTLEEAQLFAKDLAGKGFKAFVAKLQEVQRPVDLPESNTEKESESPGQDEGPPQIQDLRRLLRS